MNCEDKNQLTEENIVQNGELSAEKKGPNLRKRKPVLDKPEVEKKEPQIEECALDESTKGEVMISF